MTILKPNKKKKGPETDAKGSSGKMRSVLAATESRND